MTDWMDLPAAPPTVAAMFAWAPPAIPVLPAVGVVCAVVYCVGVGRLRSRGQPWPWGRTASFLSGCLILVAVMGLAIEGYGFGLFSAFMFQHLTLSILIPPLLVLGSPGVLLLRAAHHRGVGRFLLILALSGLRSPVARFVLHPGFTLPLFLFSFYGLYLSQLFDLLARTWVGHTGMEVFFLISGVLFIVPILSTGPLPVRQTNLGRFFDIFLEMPLHVFFGVILMIASAPSRDEETSNRVADQRADREGDHDLDAYNAYLRRLQAGPLPAQPGPPTTPRTARDR